VSVATRARCRLKLREIVTFENAQKQKNNANDPAEAALSSKDPLKAKAMLNV